jgi:drug/metabolite transporter (DMT)-like permease
MRGVIGAAAITRYFIGISAIGAVMATLIQNTYPVFAALLAAFFLGDHCAARGDGVPNIPSWNVDERSSE